MIGVFDSGVGGLSVWRELVKIMPDQRYVYVSDSGYCPYGPKPAGMIIERACRITEYLMAHGADMIVVACNTATAAAIAYLRLHYAIPFVGMEPAVKPAALNTETGVIGVLATQGTFKGELYLRTLHKFAANATVIEQVGEGLVELVEAGAVDTPPADILLRRYLIPMMEMHADHLVLGCTHYPFLIDAISKIVGEKMVIINPAPAVAKRVKEVVQMNIQNIPTTDNGCSVNEFVTTGGNIQLIRQMVNAIAPEHAEDYIYKSVII